VILPHALPVVPVSTAHALSATAQQSSDLGDTTGWPQLTCAVAVQDAALTREGHPPTAIFTGWYGEAAALGVLCSGYYLPAVLSGHNAYCMWGPGRTADITALVVHALSRLRPYFASCRPEQLDPAADRGVHRPRRRLAGAVAAAQALRLSRQRGRS
jgi:hypothetical protein